MNTEQEQAKAARGLRMKEWAEGPGGLFEVFDAVARNYAASLLDTDVADTAAREAMYHRQRAIADVREVCRLVIVDGYSSSKMIAELNKREQRKRKAKA